MVALRTYDDLSPPTPDGRAVSVLEPASVMENEAWIRVAAAGSGEPSVEPRLAGVCLDLGAGTGFDLDARTGELRYGSALATLSLAGSFDIYLFHARSASEADVLNCRIQALKPPGSAQFLLNLDATEALSHARDLSRVAVVGGPKIIVTYGTLSRLPFAVREVLRIVPRRYILVRVASESSAPWETLLALRYAERAVDFVVGISDVMRDTDLIGTALFDDDLGARLTSIFGSPAWRALVGTEHRGAQRILRTLYAHRLRAQLSLHVTDEAVGPGRWAATKPLFATTLERRLDLWRDATGGLAMPQDELYLDAS